MERRLLFWVLVVYSAIFLFELFSDKHRLDDTLNVEVNTDERKTSKKRKTQAKKTDETAENGQESSPANTTGKRLVVIINNRQAEVSEADEQCDNQTRASHGKIDFAHKASGIIGTTADRDIPLFLM